MSKENLAFSQDKKAILKSCQGPRMKKCLQKTSNILVQHENTHQNERHWKSWLQADFKMDAVTQKL
jgi:hypothetical protein